MFEVYALDLCAQDSDCGTGKSCKSMDDVAMDFDDEDAIFFDTIDAGPEKAGQCHTRDKWESFQANLMMSFMGRPTSDTHRMNFCEIAWFDGL
jgi:hypothetical protein